MHRRVSAAVTVMLLSGLILAGCGSKDDGGAVAGGTTSDTTAAAGSTAATKVELKAKNFTYSPTDINLTAGSDVQFVVTNGDTFGHNLTVEGLAVNQDIDGDKTVSAPVTKALKAGSYEFHCAIHPDQMKGTITVS